MLLTRDRRMSPFSNALGVPLNVLLYDDDDDDVILLMIAQFLMKSILCLF